MKDIDKWLNGEKIIVNPENLTFTGVLTFETDPITKGQGKEYQFEYRSEGYLFSCSMEFLKSDATKEKAIEILKQGWYFNSVRKLKS